MVKRSIRDKIEHSHNVIAPNSFRFKKAQKLVRKVEKEYGEVGAIYMSGSTASRRSMQDSSINLVVLHKATGPEFEKRKAGITQLARELGPMGLPDIEAGKKWYFSIRHAEASRMNEAEGIIQPEMEILHGVKFAKSLGLPAKIKSVEKKESYKKPKQADGAHSRQTNVTARKRTPAGLAERLKIERRRNSKQ